MLQSITEFVDSLLGRSAATPLDTDEKMIATAALLVHAIAIDGTVTEAESARLAELLASHFHLGPEEVNRLLTIAEQRERDAVDIYRFTSVLRDSLSLDDKREVIAMMWRLVYADGVLTPLEDNLVWRTAELLAVPARDRMLLKQMVRDGDG
jgi:uncharacterized tellurite resistance protein B-like protein